MAKAQALSVMQASLTSCPYCGGAPKLVPMPGTKSNWWRVQCQNHHCGGTTWAMPEPEQAQKAWNRRAGEQTE